MTRNSPLGDVTRLDALVLAFATAAAFWVATRTERDIETALRLHSMQWLRNMNEETAQRNRDAERMMAGRTKTLRQLYAERYPWSPLAMLNRSPVVAEAWRVFAAVRQEALPSLTVAFVGISFIAVRPSRSTGGRARWGPGRVAAAISLVFLTVGFADQIALRRFGLIKYGEYHDTLARFWEYNARNLGTAIVAAWVVLVPAGRWSLRRGWREWVGLGLGLAWVADLFWETVLKPLAQF